MDKIALIDYTPSITPSTPNYLKPLIEKHSLAAGWVRPGENSDTFMFFIGASLPYTPKNVTLTSKSDEHFMAVAEFQEYWEVEKAYNEIIKDLIDVANYKENEQIAKIDVLVATDDN